MTRYIEHNGLWVPEYTTHNRGIGDWIAKGLYKLGMKQTPGCGCSSRQRYLNELVPFGNGIRRRGDIPLISGGAGPESICADPAVYFCDNFEDRPLGATGLNNFFDPHVLKSQGWDMGTGQSSITISSSQSFDGTRSMQFQYPACDQADGGDQCSASFGSINLPNMMEIYLRHYVKWGVGFFWSSVATKHIGFFSQSSVGNVQRPYAWHEGFNFSQSAQLKMDDVGQNETNYFQNTNGVPITFTGGTWYCLELHMKKNADGTVLIEGWVNNVLKWNYPNSTMGPNPWTSFDVTGYWNHNPGDANGTRGPQQRWYDNIVVSTQRIGCLGTPPPPPPPPLVQARQAGGGAAFAGQVLSGGK